MMSEVKQKRVFEEKMMSVHNLKVLIYIKMCCILPNDRKIANEGWFFASISQYKIYGIL